MATLRYAPVTQNILGDRVHGLPAGFYVQWILSKQARRDLLFNQSQDFLLTRILVVAETLTDQAIACCDASQDRASHGDGGCRCLKRFCERHPQGDCLDFFDFHVDCL
jgi:hypothetical protein